MMGYQWLADRGRNVARACGLKDLVQGPGSESNGVAMLRGRAD